MAPSPRSKYGLSLARMALITSGGQAVGGHCEALPVIGPPGRPDQLNRSLGQVPAHA